jgi:hypothetical protein
VLTSGWLLIQKHLLFVWFHVSFGVCVYTLPEEHFNFHFVSCVCGIWLVFMWIEGFWLQSVWLLSLPKFCTHIRIKGAISEEWCVWCFCDGGDSVDQSSDGDVVQELNVHTFSCFLLLLRGRDSSVSIATGYGLDGPGIETRWGRGFSHTSRPAPGPTQPPVQWVPGLSQG